MTTTDPYRHDEHILQRRTTDGGWRQIGVMEDADIASYVADVLNDNASSPGRFLMIDARLCTCGVVTGGIRDHRPGCPVHPASP